MPRYQKSWWNVPLLMQYKNLLAELRPDAAPTLVPLSAQDSSQPTRLALLPGSFNPLTTAHLDLAARAIASGTCDAVWFTISVRTVDKERVTGALLEDRLAVLHDVTHHHPALGVAVTNRGLYVDQAVAAHMTLRVPATLLFIVGYDKIVQIFDPRYYDNRDAALALLFSKARFLVAERDYATEHDLSDLLEQHENRPYAQYVTPLKHAAAGSLLAVSSTRVREQAAAGSIDECAAPPEVIAFINETGAYAPASASTSASADRYLLRATLLDVIADTGDRLDSLDLRALTERMAQNDVLSSLIVTGYLSGDATESRRAVARWLAAQQ